MRLYLQLHECLLPSFFRTRNIHTLHSPFICVGCLGVWGFRYRLWAPFLQQGLSTHLLCLFICVKFIFSVFLSLHLCESLWNHTLHSPVYLYICVGCLKVFGGFVMFVGAFFLERGIVTHLFRLFICVRLIFSVLLSLH